ncbi:hypothetical protein [Kibdelosporangium aridum]|uniref:hypothetical protein n=1 Tax=Kibdelosporangium aridum TaxID=2030 RepID=UPI00163CA39F|nr:hypothetical protein [Kibdelosporangium aridum]
MRARFVVAVTLGLTVVAGPAIAFASAEPQTTPPASPTHQRPAQPVQQPAVPVQQPAEPAKPAKPAKTAPQGDEADPANTTQRPAQPVSGR